MKQIYLTIFGVLFLSISAFAQIFSNAAEYNNYIIKEQTAITKKTVTYIQENVHNDDDSEVEAKRTDVIKQIKKSLKKLKKMGDYYGDTKLRDEAINTFEEFKYVYEVSYKEINILAGTQQQSFEAMEKYLKAQTKAEKKLAKATARFSKAQKKFAKKNNLQLSNNNGKLEQQMQEIAEVNDYSRKLFLLYFKVSKINGLVLDGMNNKKASVVKSKSKDLVTTAEEALVVLNQTSDFKGNSEYRKATKDIIEFFLKMGKEKYSQLPALMKKEKQNNLTQDDVNAYNGIIEYYNDKATDLTNKFNEENQKLLQSNISQ